MSNQDRVEETTAVDQVNHVAANLARYMETMERGKQEGLLISESATKSAEETPEFNEEVHKLATILHFHGDEAPNESDPEFEAMSDIKTRVQDAVAVATELLPKEDTGLSFADLLDVNKVKTVDDCRNLHALIQNVCNLDNPNGSEFIDRLKETFAPLKAEEGEPFQLEAFASQLLDAFSASFGK